MSFDDLLFKIRSTNRYDLNICFSFYLLSQCWDAIDSQFSQNSSGLRVQPDRKSLKNSQSFVTRMGSAVSDVILKFKKNKFFNRSLLEVKWECDEENRIPKPETQMNPPYCIRSPKSELYFIFSYLHNKKVSSTSFLIDLSIFVRGHQNIKWVLKGWLRL